MFDFGISIRIEIEILTFPGISIGIGIDQTQDKSQYRNWYRKSWYRRLLLRNQFFMRNPNMPLLLLKNCINIGGWRLFRIILENGTKIFEEESTVRFDNFECIICSIFICRLYFSKIFRVQRLKDHYY